MFLATTEAPSELSELQTMGHMLLASCHSQSHVRKLAKINLSFGLNSLPPVAFILQGK